MGQRYDEPHEAPPRRRAPLSRPRAPRQAAQTSRRKSRRLESLARLARDLNATLSVGEVLQRVVDAAVELLATDVARVWVVDEDGAHVSLRAAAGRAGAAGGLARIEVGEGLVGGVVAGRAPVRVPDLRTDPRGLDRSRLGAEGMISVLAVPLLVGERALGALAVGRGRPHEFGTEEVGLLESLASQAAIALDNARLFSEEQARRAHLASLLEINTKIGATASTETLLTTIAEEAARLLGVDNAGFRLLEGEDLVLAGLAGAARETMLRSRIRVGESLSGKVARAGRTLMLDIDESADIIPEHFAADRRLGYTKFLGVPLQIGGRTIGVLTFRARRPFTEPDRELAEAFASQAAIALEHARLFDEAARHGERMRALADLGRMLSETLDPDVVGRRVVEAVRTLIRARSSVLYGAGEGGELRAVALSREAETFEWVPALAPGTGLSGLAARERRALAAPDVLADPRIRYVPEVRAHLEATEFRAILAVPMLVRGRLLGVLAVADRTGRVFDDEEVRLAQAFADEAALALENARLYAEAARRRREAEELARLARELTKDLDVAAVVERTAASVLSLFNAQSSIIRLLQPDGSLVALAVGGRARHVIEPGHVLPPGAGVLGRVAAEGRPLASADAPRDPAIALPDDLRQGIDASADGAILAVPLRAKGLIVGVLGIADRPGRVYTPEEVALLQGFADQAAVAIDNARLYHAAEGRATRLSTLTRLSHLVTSSLDTGAVLRSIARAAREIMGAPFVGFWMADETRRTLRMEVFSEDAAGDPLLVTELRFGEGVVGWVAEHRRSLVIPDVFADGRFTALEWARRRGLRSVFAAPIVHQDTLLGVLVLIAARSFAPGRDDEELLESFSAQAAAAIQNARLYEQSRRYADRLRALEEVNRLVSSSLNPEQVLQNLARAIAQFFDAPYVSVWAFDAAAGRLRRALTHGDPAAAAALRDELALGEGAVGRVALRREPILWTDVRTDAGFLDAQPLIDRGLPWITAYPIAIGERLLGAFAVHRATAWPLTPETTSLMGSLAAQAAIALENARLYSETARRLAETRALLEVAEILNSTLESRQLLKRIAVKIAQVCRVDRCTLEAWDGDRVVPLMSQFADGRKAPDLWKAFHVPSPEPLRAIPANVRVIETRQPLVIDDAAATTLIPSEWVTTFGLKSCLIVPLVRQERVIGVMTLDYCERPTPFSPWQQDLALAIAGQVAFSLENTRLYDEIQERLRETSALLAVARALSQPGPREEVMRRVAAEVGRTFHADMVGVYLLDEARQALLPVGGYHVPRELLEFFRHSPMVLARFPGLAPAFREPRIIASGDVHADPAFDSEWTHRLPPCSMLFAPTMVHGEPVGGLFLVWWETGHTWSPADVRLLEGVAAQVGLAIENAELARQTQLKLAETERLLSVSRALGSTLDFRGLVRHFLRRVAAAIGCDSVGLWQVEDGDWLVPVQGYRMPPEHLAAVRRVRISLVEDGLYAEAARSRRALFVADVPSDPRVPAHVRESAPHRSQLFVPIVVKDRMIGGFAAVWWERTRQFGPGDLALMEAIASQAGVALENARLFEENRRRMDELSVLHELSRAVTGELDRTALLEAVRSQIARVLDARNLLVLLRDEERGDVEVALRVLDGVVDTRPPLRYPTENLGLMSVVLARGRPLRTDDYVAECARQGVAPIDSSRHLAHWLGVPLAASERMLGVLSIRAERPFSEADERLLANIGQLAALALRSARLYEERTRAYRELSAAQDQLVRTEKLRALGEMASGVAHDFNNLLASVLGRAQLLLRRVQDPQLRKWLQVIERSALDGAQTVRRLQELTRIRRDQPFVAVDLTQVVREALDITQGRWREEPATRGVTFEVRTALGSVPPIDGDPAELREAMTNLILNAVDAMPDGGILTVATAAVGDRVEVTMTDTGVGMSPATREKIFDPFFTTKGPRGTGLGLSLTYGIVARHGGQITVESEEGRGSTFRLAFPRGTAALPANAVSAEPAAPGRALRCLVVDDEVAVRGVLTDILESAGHTVVALGDGAEALARVHGERFDLVLTDLAMPRVTGWQVARAVKEAAPDTPVFLVTGFGVELSPDERRAHGVDAILVKPLQVQEILDAVADVARGRARPG